MAGKPNLSKVDFCQNGHPCNEENIKQYKSGQNYCYTCKLEGNRLRNYRLKVEVLAAYGNSCICCGEKVQDFLAIDHISNNGSVHRKKESIGTGTSTYRWLKRNGYPKDFQILCHNCNWAKHLHGVCPYH